MRTRVCANRQPRSSSNVLQISVSENASMSDLYVVATMVSREGKADALRDALLPAVEAFRLEDGCLSYALLEDHVRPGRFMTFERWRDRAALDAHMQSAAMKALAPRIPELLGEALKQDLLAARLLL